jgi:TolB-like protein/tetratricopeptide (TPR) repeat protein
MSDREPPLASDTEPQFPRGEYAIEGVLGSGGMAVVYRARDLRRPRQVAIKVLRSDVAKLIGAERFLREIAVTAGFTHPHILPLLDSGETVDAAGRSCPYYVMPLITGESLEDRLLKERRLPLKDAIRLTCEILEAIRYAHEHGVIHRDIKPANILLSDGHAVVADFGVARPMPGSPRAASAGKSITEFGFIVGTPEYMSPEQALGDERVDERCDLYSVGCVLYEMVVGTPPFEAPTAQMIVSRKISGAFAPITAMRSGVPMALDEILAKALKAEPSDRYTSAAAFLDDLSRLDVRTSASQAAAKGQQRSARPLWIGAGAVTTLALVGTYAFTRKTPHAVERPAPVLVADKARVAVLPMAVVTPDSALDIVASALTSDLIDELARFPALTVISKNGVLPFRGGAARSDSVARVLGVGSIVTGDMRGFGDSVAVTVRLIDGATSAQLASMTTTGTSRDALSLRSSIIDSVASFLRKRIGVEVTASSTRGASNSDAWETLARAKLLMEGELTRSGELSPMRRAARFAVVDSLLAQATSRDPDWMAPRLQRIALLLLRANIEEVVGATEPATTAAQGAVTAPMLGAMRRNAVRMADDVLEASPGNAGALLLRGRARSALWRTATAEAPDSLRLAAEADLRAVTVARRDMAEAWNELSTLQHMSGAFADARNAADAALKADAYLKNAAAVLSRLFFSSLSIGRVDEARKWCDLGIAKYPGDPRFWGCDLTILGWTGREPADVDRAWAALAASESRDAGNLLASGWGTRRLLVAAVAARAGLGDSALAIVQRVRAASRTGASAAAVDFGEAHVYALLQQPDRAMPLLERYLRENPALRGQVRHSPWFASLRADPRFMAITGPR